MAPSYGDFMIKTNNTNLWDSSNLLGNPVHPLDKFAYFGNDLGAVYSKEKTVFKFWSPEALAVTVRVYATGSDNENGAKVITDIAMEKTAENVWCAEYPGDHKNEYYTYVIDFNGRRIETVDIYAKAAGVNGERGMIVDLTSTDPEGWQDDKHIFVDSPTDAVVWEVHVKDFSHSPSSGITKEHRGKYLAFTEHSTLYGEGIVPTCVDYLKNLGVTHVQITPFYDFGSVNEAAQDDSYNWGYDPKNYNVPEGSYSTNPFDGNVRITECKQMIKALHDAGIGVIMDVVYNHTYQAQGSYFDRSVPGYYYRYNKDGSWSNGSGCSNDTASEHLMYRKFMIDSVLYWAKEYHIDGFRFDLMGLHDAETMRLIRKAVDDEFGKDNIILYGEGWHMGTACAYGTQMANQSAVRSMPGVGAFNDNMRDAIKGSVFGAYDKGFVQCGSCAERIKSGIVAETGSWAEKASQCVNYASCHDNYALYDKLILSERGGTGYAERFDSLVSMTKLSASIILTSQGVPFFLAGEEIARTKFGDENSYCSSAEVNQIDWENTGHYADLILYYQGLIRLRKKLPALRGSNKVADTSKLRFVDSAMPCVSYIVDFEDEDVKGHIFVAHNPCDYDVRINLADTGLSKDTKWIAVVNKHSSGTAPLMAISELALVESKSSVVLIDEKAYKAIFKR